MTREPQSLPSSVPQDAREGHGSHIDLSLYPPIDPGASYATFSHGTPAETWAQQVDWMVGR